MRFAPVVLFAALCAIALSTPVVPEKGKVADKVFLEKQKNIFRLFKYINQPSYYKDHVEIASNYNPETNVAGYTKPEYVEHFFHYYHHDILQRDEIFSVFHEYHLKQAIALFKLFYYAKDYDTFYKTAVWARNHVNQGMFLYSFSVAVAHRPDTHGIVLPPIYEIYPYYFYNSEVIHQAQQYKQGYFGEHHEGHQEHSQHQDTTYPGHLIHANYSGHYLNLHPDQSLSYYLEDVGINSFYYYFNIFYPYWMCGEEFGLKNDHRGEQYYYVHQQLLARYYLERLSSSWDEIKFFNWEVPFETGYYPSLTYPNGLEFPTRPNFAKLHEYFYNYGQRWSFKSKYGYSPVIVKDLERRILDTIALGYALNDKGEKVDLYNDVEGFNVVGNFIEGNHDSINHRYYGHYETYARHLLGYAPQPLDYHHTFPSALEHYETSMRDPAFYSLYKKIVLFFQTYKFNLKPYTQKDLHFDGVKVTKVDMDRLITYFEDFDADITNAVYVTPEEFEEDKFHVRARQQRLTHKPFTYKLTVHSDKETKASVRVYIGPKHDEYGRDLHLNENRFNFVQFDQFVHDLKTGDNVIERNSHENFFFRDDSTTYHQLYKQVLGALEGGEKFYINGKQAFFGFPTRYLLPKGTFDGYEYQFYFIVSPYVEYKHHQTVSEEHVYPVPGTGAVHLDGYAFGYPFDRPLDVHHFYDAPNIYSYSAKIYHRHAEDINASTSQH